jgi:hypothetical protein
MPRSAQKAVLFGRATHNGQHHFWPIAAFNTPADARKFAAFLKMAYMAGNNAVIKDLDPAAPFHEEGFPVEPVRWSVKIVPYAPSAALGDVTEDD